MMLFALFTSIAFIHPLSVYSTFIRTIWTLNTWTETNSRHKEDGEEHTSLWLCVPTCIRPFVCLSSPSFSVYLSNGASSSSSSTRLHLSRRRRRLPTHLCRFVQFQFSSQFDSMIDRSWVTIVNRNLTYHFFVCYLNIELVSFGFCLST